MRKLALVVTFALSLCSARAAAWAAEDHSCCPAEQSRGASVAACCPAAVAPSTVRVQAPAAEPVPEAVAVRVPTTVSRLSAAPLVSPLSAALLPGASPRAPPLA